MEWKVDVSGVDTRWKLNGEQTEMYLTVDTSGVDSRWTWSGEETEI